MNDKLGGKVMTKFVGLRAKSCSYLTDDGSKDKKAKDTKKCVIKRKLKFKIIKTVWKQLSLIINKLFRTK